MLDHARGIVQDRYDVRQALSRIGLSSEMVIAVARAAAAARAETLPVDPISAPGWFAYAYGVRHIRLQLLPLDGWRLSRTANVESAINDVLGVQICFQNVDVACDTRHEPQAISRKGTASRQQVADGQGELFAVPCGRKVSRLGCAPAVWIICVQITDTSLCAEVSCPRAFDGAQFVGFHERIFVLKEDYDGVDPARKTKVDDTEEVDVPVSKRR